jgi:FAD/FMN-containing dehydrogenase
MYTLDQLALDLDGTLSRPGDASWENDRAAWNLAVDQSPVAVVVAGSVRDVQSTVRAARDAGLRVAPQSTGHNASPMGALDDTILLKLSALRDVTIDPEHRIARVEGGALWGDVTPAAAKHGLIALAGSAADVGVAGYTLGGGVSWLARSHGLACNHVTALEVVTADGRVRRADAHHDPELFWALRGGGGSFGIVTALELQLYPIAELYAGTLFFPLERASEVLHAWSTFVKTVPAEVMSIGRVLRFPPLPDLPPFLSGQSYVVVEAASTLDQETTDALLEPLRALGPAIDTFAMVEPEGLALLHMDPPGPVPGSGDGFMLSELAPETVDAFVRVAGPDADVPLLSVELRHLGAALTPGLTEHGGAVDGLPASFLGFAVGIAPTPEIGKAVANAVTAVQHAMAPWSTGGCYINFAERRKTGAALFGKETYERLQAVKAEYDPANVIRANQPVAPKRRRWQRVYT